MLVYNEHLSCHIRHCEIFPEYGYLLLIFFFLSRRKSRCWCWWLKYLTFISWESEEGHVLVRLGCAASAKFKLSAYGTEAFKLLLWDLSQSQSQAEIGCLCGCMKPHVAFTPLSYIIPQNCPAPAFVLSWQRSSSAPNYLTQVRSRWRERYCRHFSWGCSHMLTWSLVRQQLMVPMLALHDPLSGLNSHKCFTLGVWTLGRHNMGKSESRGPRRWKGRAMFWSHALEGGQKLDMFMDQHLGRSLISFV